MNQIVKPIWTRFFDMSSGGSSKLDHEVIWIEATEEKAVQIFEDMFGRNPDNITCYCCGEDFSYYQTEFKPEIGDAIVSVEDMNNFYGDGG